MRLVTILGLGLMSGSLAAGELISESFDAAPGDLIEIDLESGGAIEIVGSGSNQISVDARLKGDLTASEVTIVRTASGVRITSDRKRRRGNGSVDLELMVPEQANLRFETSGGRVSIENVEGDIEGETMGGAMMLSSLTGQIDVKTMGGKIRMRDSMVDGEVSTMGGNINFDGVFGSLSAETMGGNVSLENMPAPKQGARNEVQVSTMGGNVTVDKALAGAEVETMGGNINIGEAGDYVRAKTMGGNINVASLDGGIEAETMGGSVNVNVVGHGTASGDIDLSTQGGEVRLAVPQNMSMDVEIELKVTDNAKRDYEIVSDFDLDQEVDTKAGRNVDYVLKAGGSVEGGTHKVRIYAVNGEVRLVRGK